VKFGRKPKLAQRKEAARRRDAGEPVRDIARHLQRQPKHGFVTCEVIR